MEASSCTRHHHHQLRLLNLHRLDSTLPTTCLRPAPSDGAVYPVVELYSSMPGAHVFDLGGDEARLGN